MRSAPAAAAARARARAATAAAAIDEEAARVLDSLPVAPPSGLLACVLQLQTTREAESARTVRRTSAATKSRRLSTDFGEASTPCTRQSGGVGVSSKSRQGEANEPAHLDVCQNRALIDLRRRAAALLKRFNGSIVTRMTVSGCSSTMTEPKSLPFPTPRAHVPFFRPHRAVEFLLSPVPSRF